MPLVYPVGVHLVGHRPSPICLLMYPAWPFHREHLPAFSHNPKKWPREDPELEEHTSPPDELVMPISVDPMVRHDDSRSRANRIRDTDVASVIGASDHLSHLLGDGVVVNAGHVSRESESTSHWLSGAIVKRADLRLGSRTRSTKAVAPFLE